MSDIVYSDRIPLDIWSNIFLECLPSHDQPFVPADPLSAPLLLCQVNRAWRSTALSLSSLWSSISLEVSGDDDTEGMVEGVETWLRRSGTRPLAISLVWKAAAPRRVSLNMDPILDLVIPFIGRWETVRLDVLGPFSRGPMSNIHRLRAPLLKRCEVCFYEAEITPFLSMLSSCPHLTEFVLHNDNYMRFSDIESSIPWSQLTRFETSLFLNTHECLKMLRLCPDLVDCTFHDSTLSDAFIPKEVPIVHQRLRALTLGRCSQIDSLINYITLPALSSLSLQSHWWELGPLVAFLVRSGTLKTFEVHTTAVSTDQLIELLHHLPKLTELSIKGSIAYPLGDVLFESLTYDETADHRLPLCPELQVITLAGYIESTEGTLAKMLRSRCHSESSRP